MGRRWAFAVAVWLGAAATAAAEEAPPSGDSGLTRAEARWIVEAYLADAEPDATLVGGAAGTAGHHDGNFFVRSGPFKMELGVAMQPRFEGWDWVDDEDEAEPGGDASGFSLPRASVWAHGRAACGIRWHAELEFGHALAGSSAPIAFATVDGVPGEISLNDDLPVALEMWIGAGGPDELSMREDILDMTIEDYLDYYDLYYDELDPEDFFEIHMAAEGRRRRGFLRAFGLEYGVVPVPGPRQLLTPWQMRQFADVSLGTAWIANLMPVWLHDRTRDLGLRVHWTSEFRSPFQLAVMGAVTNGEGPDTRNVLDFFSDDHVAFSGRIDLSYGRRPLFVENALAMRRRQFAAGLGIWAYTLHHASQPDRELGGVDAYVKLGGFTYTGGYNRADFEDGYDGWSYHMQFGYHVPDTAIEFVARVSEYEDSLDWGAREYGFGVNYYLDGARNRIGVEGAFVEATGDVGNVVGYSFPPYLPTGDGDAWTVKLHWQISL
jgi:hypothetical protein